MFNYSVDCVCLIMLIYLIVISDNEKTLYGDEHCPAQLVEFMLIIINNY